MKFYQNKTTGEIIGVQNMRQVIDLPTEQSISSGFKNYSYKIVYDMICPNHILGNGITSFCITHAMLSKNYKRIRREIAFKKYPKFIQYGYEQFEAEKKKIGIPGIEILRKQTF